MKSRVYILGGYQTDFARNWSREGKGIQAMINEVMAGAFADTDIDPGDIQSIHVGNFAGELYTMQAHFGALTLNYDPALRGLPELMKSVDSKIGGNYLGTAAWYEKECVGIEFPFPKLFDRLYDVYDEIYGVKYEHLAQIATVNYENAKKNPKAQTRNWYMNKKHACSSGEYNRTIGRRLRATDCSQVTDGAAALFLASHKYAEGYAKKHNLNLSKIPYIQGWGHATAPIRFSDKAEEAKKSQYVLPHTRKAILEAFQRSNIHGVEDISCIETHDCFTITEYAAIEHFGLTKPGEGFKAIEDGTIELNGSCPINPSGGLIGGGHPVGATGTRQLLDAYLQVSGKAGDYQVAGAKRVATLNIGGSATTNVVHILGSDTNGS